MEVLGGERERERELYLFGVGIKVSRRRLCVGSWSIYILVEKWREKGNFDEITDVPSLCTLRVTLVN